MPRKVSKSRAHIEDLVVWLQTGERQQFFRLAKGVLVVFVGHIALIGWLEIWDQGNSKNSFGEATLGTVAGVNLCVDRIYELLHVAPPGDL